MRHWRCSKTSFNLLGRMCTQREPLVNCTIYGERCSGTTYLQDLISTNFDTQVRFDYGWKHFFGHCNGSLEGNSDTLFICIVRNPVDWVNSFWRTPWHLKLPGNPVRIGGFDCGRIPRHEFLEREVASFHPGPDGSHVEEMGDRNMYTGERYRNILEMRHTKLKWLLDDLPQKVDHYAFVRHEDLLHDFEATMWKIRGKGLRVRPGARFPVNTTRYKGEPGTTFKKKPNVIPSRAILSHPSFSPHYEKKLGYAA